MKTQMLITAIAAGLVLQAVPAAAQGPGDRPDFATLDADGDGAITLEEMQLAGAARFAQTDTDGDGALSAEELTAQMSQRAERGVARMIARLDTNEDGLLQQSEMQARGGDRLAQMFARADADEDGQISEAEFDAVKDRMGRRGGKHGGKGQGRGHGGRG